MGNDVGVSSSRSDITCTRIGNAIGAFSAGSPFLLKGRKTFFIAICLLGFVAKCLRFRFVDEVHHSPASVDSRAQMALWFAKLEL